MSKELPQSQYMQFDNGQIKFEANFSPESIPCREIKVIIGDKQVILSRDEFSSILTAFADQNQLEYLVTHANTDLVSVERMFKVKAKNDVKAGESLVFPFQYFLPKQEYEELKNGGEMIKLIEHETDKLVKLVSENEAAREVKQMFKDGKLSTC